MVASTTVDDYKIVSKSIKSVRDRVTNISEHLPAAMSAEAFKASMVRHIMGGSTATYAVTPEDDARIREIAQERFAGWERIFGADPRFNIERTGRFVGGKMQFKLDVRKGTGSVSRSSGDQGSHRLIRRSVFPDCSRYRRKDSRLAGRCKTAGRAAADSGSKAGAGGFFPCGAGGSDHEAPLRQHDPRRKGRRGREAQADRGHCQLPRRDR